MRSLIVSVPNWTAAASLSPFSRISDAMLLRTVLISARAAPAARVVPVPMPEPVPEAPAPAPEEPSTP